MKLLNKLRHKHVVLAVAINIILFAAVQFRFASPWNFVKESQRNNSGFLHHRPNEMVTRSVYDTGSRANHSSPEVDNMIKQFKERYTNFCDKVNLQSEEPYTVFLKRMNTYKRKGDFLIKEGALVKNNPVSRFHRGINKYYMYDDDILPELLTYLNTEPITEAAAVSGGSQPKLKISFSDGFYARFKAMRQPKTAETHGDTFFFWDYERHTSEIAAFHLDRALGFHKAIPTVGRIINITSELENYLHNKTFVEFVYTSPTGKVCFIPRCLQFCGKKSPICGDKELLNGSVSAGLPVNRKYRLSFIKYPFKHAYEFNATNVGSSKFNHLIVDQSVYLSSYE